MKNSYLWDDEEENMALQARAKKLVRQFNALPPEDMDGRAALLPQLFGEVGKNVLISPNVTLSTTGHPIHPVSRNSAYEYGREVTVGDNVWFGGNTVICSGVRIGDNVVIGAGSVVTRDIPDWCIAAGNPCRVIGESTENDRRKLFRDEEIDGEAWQDILERMEF